MIFHVCTPFLKKLSFEMSSQFLSISGTLFYKKLSSEMSTQFLSISSTQFLRGFVSERDFGHFLTKTRSFLEKWLASFLCTWNMSTRFLNSEKI